MSPECDDIGGGGTMKQVVEGSHAVSEAVRLARVQVVSAYPITPQTHIVEAISEFCIEGTMDARFINVESEHSAMAAVIGASSGGVRTFTATSSQGLVYMHELLHWASAARLPIVMGEVNRALAPGWNIWTDQTDSLAQRDTGWIQLYCEDGQEVFDTTLLAFRLAESVNLPVMVVMDAFLLSHTYEPVDVAAQEVVDQFLPAYSPRFQLDTKDPYALSQFMMPTVYMELRHSIHKTMEKVPSFYEAIEASFKEIFGRDYGTVEAVQCEDADIIFVVSGVVTSNCRMAISELRSQGEKVGLLKIKMFRPFPADLVRKHLRNARKVAVIDRNFSMGASGIFAQETRAVLCNMDKRPQVFGYVAGLGGRDITSDSVKEIYLMTKKSRTAKEDSVWIGLNE